jgi:hypothetical protein
VLGTRTLAAVMYDLNVHRVVLHDEQPMALAPADTLTAVLTCRDCGAELVRRAGAIADVCELCYANRLIHGGGQRSRHELAVGTRSGR